MSDDKALTAEQLVKIGDRVERIKEWAETSWSEEERRLVELWDYISVPRERNQRLGVAVANADKHSEWDQHDAYFEGYITAGDVHEYEPDANPYEKRP